MYVFFSKEEDNISHYKYSIHLYSIHQVDVG